MDFGNIFDTGSKYLSKGMDYLGKGADFYNKHQDAFDFGLKGLQAYSQWDAQNKMADIARQQNAIYKSQFDRQKKREEEAEDAFALGFQNSSFGNVV